jgi:hypothetical protein
MESAKFLCSIKNFSPHLCFIHISYTPLKEDTTFKIKLNKNFGYKHYHLNEHSNISFKLISKGDDESGVYHSSNKRYVTVHTKNYYYSVWIYVNNQWKNYCFNRLNQWNDNINILNV